MPSVSSISIGGNMAAAAASKARHGMNESIARLSTGQRAMYGGDAAGTSMGHAIAADGKGYAQASRNIEDGISFAQMGESVLLEVWVCPPPDVGSELHVPKSMVNVPEPTVAVVAEYVGPVKVCALARVDTVNDEFIVAAASEPEAERVAIVVSDEFPTYP